jgi:hypothetical protein
MKKVAIMQPYFMPYIGYWQLINSVDEFVVYDNIEFTKKGWFNRNRILEIDHDRLFTIPIKKDSDFLPVNQRCLSDDSEKEINRSLHIIQNNYKKAPYFNEAYPLIERSFMYSSKNLFEYIFNSIKLICDYLDITTKIVISSKIDINHSLKASSKVLEICKAEGAEIYINAIGGRELYDKEVFKVQGIDLNFIQTKEIIYKQFNNGFVPGLSIIDVLMFNSKEQIKHMLEEYELL